MRILGIETSCDETAAAVVEDGRTIICSALYSQIPIHQTYGGVVPEIAARAHAEKLPILVPEILQQAQNDVDAVAVTYGPGLVGALVTGVAFAKGLAFAHGKPLIGVDHIAGHIAALYLSYPKLEPPFICLVVSGGHTEIIKVTAYDEMEVLGSTRDDAVGEAIDKVARKLGLPYPGGPHLQELARSGNPLACTFPRSFRGQDHLDFSFSGPKTAVVNMLAKEEHADGADVAASFLHSVVSVLADNTRKACERTGIRTVGLAGGVAANLQLREAMQEMCEENGFRLYLPDLAFCGDNAAMIASAAYYAPEDPNLDTLYLNADPGADLDAYRTHRSL